MSTLKELIAEGREEFFLKWPEIKTESGAVHFAENFIESLLTRAYSLGEVEGRKGVETVLKKYYSRPKLNAESATEEVIDLTLKIVAAELNINLTNK